MKVKEYLERMNSCDAVTFVKARARKDANTPYFHPEYQTTPIHSVGAWQTDKKILNSIILNDKQMPIDWLSGVMWGNAVKDGSLKCLLIVSKKDFESLYSKEQCVSIERYIERRLQK